jgi:hypothetical protein
MSYRLMETTRLAIYYPDGFVALTHDADNGARSADPGSAAVP